MHVLHCLLTPDRYHNMYKTSQKIFDLPDISADICMQTSSGAITPEEHYLNNNKHFA